MQVSNSVFEWLPTQINHEVKSELHTRKQGGEGEGGRERKTKRGKRCPTSAVCILFMSVTYSMDTDIVTNGKLVYYWVTAKQIKASLIQMKSSRGRAVLSSVCSLKVDGWPDETHCHCWVKWGLSLARFCIIFFLTQKCYFF